MLRALKPITASNVEQVTVRGQYRAAHRPEARSRLSRRARRRRFQYGNFVAIKAEISNWRLGRRAFYLRTGKRMAGRMSEIVITFKQIPHSIFDQSAGRIRPTSVMIRPAAE